MRHFAELNDDSSVDAVIFEALEAEMPFSDVDVDDLLALPEPWVWEWKTPLRCLTEQIIGDTAVTAWTLNHVNLLRDLMDEPVELLPSLAAFREQETSLLPAVADVAVSAESEQ